MPPFHLAVIPLCGTGSPCKPGALWVTDHVIRKHFGVFSWSGCNSWHCCICLKSHGRACLKFKPSCTKCVIYLFYEHFHIYFIFSSFPIKTSSYISIQNKFDLPENKKKAPFHNLNPEISRHPGIALALWKK